MKDLKRDTSSLWKLDRVNDVMEEEESWIFINDVTEEEEDGRSRRLDS